MLNRTTSMRMKGPRGSDAMQKRRLFVTACATVSMLSLLTICYSSFFNSRFHQTETDTLSNSQGILKVGSSGRHVHEQILDDIPLRDDDISLRDDDIGNKGGEIDTHLEIVEDDIVEEKNDSKLEEKETDEDIDSERETTTTKNVDPKEEEKEEDLSATFSSFPVCSQDKSEIIPCLDPSVPKALKVKLNHSVMEHYERHCPPPDRRLNCLIPPPPRYEVPVRWPTSRDEVRAANVPHTFLALNKSDQHWMEIEGDKAIFPGGGTHFHDGADKYIVSLAKMLGNDDGDFSLEGKIRTVFDVGCGVASFGAFLLPHETVAMSLAPNDVHANQIQFALERGIPSMLGILATTRLPFPSKSFDLAHCSRCRIDWHKRDGILLLEVDRLLRPGGYFAWSSPAAYREDESDREEWDAMNILVTNMCWEQAAKEAQTVIWRKPLTSECYDERPAGVHPPMCSSAEDPDDGWYVKMQSCITPMTKHAGVSLKPWPERLNSPPPRLRDDSISDETYQTDTFVWNQRVQFYWKQLKLAGQVEADSLRNIMDMNANLGGFAAALVKEPVWVMNAVSPSGPNTLKTIFDRGLIGALHDWCESFSTYPRTYDLLHAWNVFSKIDEKGCSLEDLLLEMDRIVRPMGIIIIRDKASLVNQISKYLTALRWDAWSKDDFKMAPDALSYEDDKILMARKQLWQPSDDSLSNI